MVPVQTSCWLVAGSAAPALSARRPSLCPLPRCWLLGAIVAEESTLGRRTVYRDTSPRAKEALSEGGDEADFDKEADDCFNGGDDRHRVVELEATGKEAAPMERGQAEHRRLDEVEGMAVHDAEVEI